MDKPCWDAAQGVYFVDDATATVETYKAETLTTFGTQMSKLSHDDPEVQQTRSRALENCYHMMSPFGIHPKPNNRAFHLPIQWNIRNHIGNEVIHKLCT